MIRIVLNGANREVSGSTLDEILLECGYQSSTIATAVNSRFIHRHQRADTEIHEGDHIEVVAPIEGG